MPYVLEMMWIVNISFGQIGRIKPGTLANI